MTPRTSHRIAAGRLLGALAALGIASLSVVMAQDTPRSPRSPAAGIPPGIEVEADRFERSQDGARVELTGSVTLSWGPNRMQADHIVLREGRWVEAGGNVLVIWGPNRVSGARMVYDLREEHGVIEDAIGQMDPEFYFTAERAEKVGDDRVILERATITTCTQPVPYWSFSVSRAKVRIEGYARLTNVRLRAKRMPVFYFPYLLWPAKRDRAPGLLFPQFGNTNTRGSVISQGVFIPLGRSADTTIYLQHYSLAGWGGGTEVRWLPNPDGQMELTGYYIDDKVHGDDRYKVTFQQSQRFANGYRLVANVLHASDFSYFTDFERSLQLTSTSTLESRFELSRSFSWTSLNTRVLRREQLQTGDNTLVQATFPEIELRGRSKRLGRSPFYFEFRSSLAGIRQDGPNIDASYLRADLFPTLSVPFSPFPWLDVTPSFSARGSWWSKSREPGTGTGSIPTVVRDESVTRSVAGAGVDLVGPKFFRIFERPDKPGAARYKHSVETFASYGWRGDFDRNDEILRYDAIDNPVAASSLLTYGLRTRLFAQRPRAERPTAPLGTEAILFPETAGREEAPSPTPTPVRRSEPVEILLVELRQDRSLRDLDLSQADLDGDGIIDEVSRFGPVNLRGTFRPTRTTNLTLSLQYHILFKEISRATFSGGFGSGKGRLGFSLSHLGGLGFDSTGEPRRDSTQLSMNTHLRLFNQKLRLFVDTIVNLDTPAGASRVPSQNYRVEYYTQCCGFIADYLERSFGPETGRRDYRFTIDLRGIGKFLDFHQGEER
jgi:hypothetical protein